MERIQTRAAPTRTLRLDMVLEKVARSLPPKDLFRLRPTCRGWNRHFVPEIRSRHKKLTMSLPPAITGKFYTQEKLARLAVCAQSSGGSGFPFSKIAIMSTGEKNYALFRDFFSACAMWITCLEIRISYPPAFLDMYEVRRTLFELTPGLREFTLDLAISVSGREKLNCMPNPGVCQTREIPKLKRLVMTQCGPSVVPELRELIEDLVRCAVCLEQLLLDDSSAPVALSALLDSVSARDLPAMLKSLEWNKAKDYAHDLQVLQELAALAQNPLRLKVYLENFSCYRRGREGEAELLGQFLATQSETLEELRVSSLVRFPVLPRLNQISLWPLSIDSVKYEAETLDRNFPSLTKFDLRLPAPSARPSCRGQLSDALPDLLAHHGVVDLSLHGKFDGNTLTRLAALFPSVTRCRLSLTYCKDLELEAIWTAWPGLRVLHLNHETISRTHPGPNIDELLAGIPKSTHAELKREVSNSRITKGLADLRAMARKYKISPGLSDLRNLQRFTLNISSKAGAQTLTDIGGYFGLAMASPTLQHVDVTFPSILTGGCVKRLVTAREAGLGFSGECAGTIQEALGQLTLVDIKYKGGH